MSKYKYYFTKPRAEIVKDVLQGILIAGAISVAATSPYFGINILKCLKNKKQYKNKNIYNTFYNLKKQECIKIEKRNHQLYISLSEKGKRMAGRFQIDNLKIKKTKKWDKVWRIVIFDISQLRSLQRNLFRGKLKELGFYLLQKSVWVYPYPCKDEIDLLREFFGLSEKEIRLISSDNIGDNTSLRKHFNLN